MKYENDFGSPYVKLENMGKLINKICLKRLFW